MAMSMSQVSPAASRQCRFPPRKGTGDPRFRADSTLPEQPGTYDPLLDRHARKLT
jgi:hypothetical protein